MLTRSFVPSVAWRDRADDDGASKDVFLKVKRPRKGKGGAVSSRSIVHGGGAAAAAANLKKIDLAKVGDLRGFETPPKPEGSDPAGKLPVDASAAESSASSSQKHHESSRPPPPRNPFREARLAKLAAEKQKKAAAAAIAAANARLNEDPQGGEDDES